MVEKSIYKLFLYNTLGRKIQQFQPINPPNVGIYSCGPTVYWYQHIGNLRTYIFSDLLKRTLIYDGYKVKHVMNITDVGHLTSDEDSGEDKIEKAAKKEHKTASEISNYYWKVFRDDLKKLNIIEPNIWCKATEHIKEQIELIKKLEKKGYTYKTGDGVYFDSSKLRDYGKLAMIKRDGLEAGKRVDIREKKNPTDFALWKFSKNEGERQQEWNSPWGVGFPGWHIECSAMSMKYLGEHFDIHIGGEEHIPVHHTNEIAQSEAATGKKFVNYWIHTRWLLFKGEKMSKSKGDLYTISALEEKGYNPLTFRYFCSTAHYRKQLNFTFENLDNAQNAYNRLKNIVNEIKEDGKINQNYLKKFEAVINDDIDIPKALSILWELVRDKNAVGKYKTIEKMDSIFGLDLLKKEKIEISEEVQKLLVEREKARKAKNFKLGDELRDKIKKIGYNIKDTPEGQKLEKIK
ncbi:MAG: cysteine--tRNA ligase [Candidatus Woesearchaeota archaeon]